MTDIRTEFFFPEIILSLKYGFISSISFSNEPFFDQLNISWTFLSSPFGASAVALLLHPTQKWWQKWLRNVQLIWGSWKVLISKYVCAFSSQFKSLYQVSWVTWFKRYHHQIFHKWWPPKWAVVLAYGVLNCFLFYLPRFQCQTHPWDDYDGKWHCCFVR